MNDTIRRFGYPATLIAEYRALGGPASAGPADARVAGRRRDRRGTAFADLPAEAFAELRTVVGHIETVLREAVGYEKINYLMLMMVDPHVHWHVMPRYEGEREAVGIRDRRSGLAQGAAARPSAVALDPDQIEALGGLAPRAMARR